MGNQTTLINRAIAMHLLREGQFTVASTFVREAQLNPPQVSTTTVPSPPGADTDTDMHSLQSQELQDKFANMYTILNELKGKNLVPAIQWAQAHSAELETRGSNLEFDLTKLQFVWLFKGAAVNGLPDDMNNGMPGALTYARHNFGKFVARHLREIQQLSCAMVYSSNITTSPYHTIFETSAAFSDVALSFTREFCSLLGLSAESPLYVAVTAGAIALPQLLKYTTFTKEKRTEWTTENELAFETPLPRSMIYHPIFVCPVSKEQTTQQNPPMMLPCGHVICKESLHRLTKGSRFKCPYCPIEGQYKDAREIIL
jgi:E3 ubiquitin-protein transferase RMND5